MNERLKKLLLVGGFIISVFVIAFILYALFFKPTPPPATVKEGVETTEMAKLPNAIEGLVHKKTTEGEESAGLSEADEVARGGPTQTIELTTSAVFDTILSTDGSGINFYNKADSRFYTIDENGNVVTLSDKQFPDVQTVEWNKDSDMAVIEFPDGSNIIYDFNSENQVTLPSHWEDFDFSPVKNELIAKSMALDPNNRSLVITSADGSNTMSIQALGENADKVDVNWSPNDQIVGFAKTSDAIQGGLDRNVIYPVGKNQENFKGLVVEGLNFDSLWSPSGKQLLYSVAGSYSDNKPLLWIVDATSATMGDNRRSLGVNTWVDKCTWHSSALIYCAVPLDLPANAGLGRELYKDEPDALYKIDLTTGSSSLVAIPEDYTPMNNIQISSDGSVLYFTNKFDQLELMRLK